MNKIRSLLKKNFRFFNMFIAAITAFLLSAVIYKTIFPICIYSNLNDFYVGTSLYMNHNKHLDIGILFIYVFIYLALYLLIKIKIPKTYIKFDIFKYKKIINIILFLVSIAIIIQFIAYLNISNIPDPHHYGEKYVAYWLNCLYGMKYYKDIMLVHGYLDIIPSWIADNILGGLTFKTERISIVFLQFAMLTVNTILATIVFKKRWSVVFLSSGLLLFVLGFHNVTSKTLYTSFLHVGTLVLAYLLLLEKINTKNNFVWNLGFYIVCFFGLTYHTTIGTISTIAMLPLFVYRFRYNPKYSIIFWSICIVFTGVLFGNDIVNYLHKAQYYVSSNLYAFGNIPKEEFSMLNLYKFIFATLSLIVSPIILILLIITKNKNIRLICIYTLIIVFGLLNYSLGRMDSLRITRLWDVNLIILSVVIPYILYKYQTRYLYVYNIVIFLLFYNYSYVCGLPYLFYKDYSILYQNNPQFQFVKENTNESNTILDLNNSGMNYYFAQRKAAIPYTSFYNMVNTKQNIDTLQELIKNPPQCVILSDNYTNIYYDEIKFPLRINKIYHWIFESGLYKLVEKNNALYLVYSPDTYPNKIEYTPNMDKIFNKNLYKLPDVWGKSIKTLPMKYVPQELKINNNTINSDKEINTHSADLLYIKYSSGKPTDFAMHIDNNNFKVIFTSNSDEILIPIDNYPSWLLQDNVREIHLDTNVPIKILSAKLYKRD